MKRTWIGVALLIGFFVLAMFLLADAAVAQTAIGGSTTTASTPPPTAGAFDRLSPGNQKIARALFDAQQAAQTPPAVSGATGGTIAGSASPAPKPLTLDNIAAMKQSGRGWGEIFKDMKQQGLVTEKNLGQVVSRSNHTSSASSHGTMITSGAGRTRVEGGSASAQAGTRAGNGGRGEDGASAGGSVSSEHGNAYGRGGGNSSHGGGRGK